MFNIKDILKHFSREFTDTEKVLFPADYSSILENQNFAMKMKNHYVRKR